MRRDDWPERLAKALQDAQAKPFAWGRHDCCLFAADIVAAMTGIDHAAALRGTYGDEAGAVDALAPLGGLEAFLTALFGPPLATPRLAQRGDVALFEFGAIAEELGETVGAMSRALGICTGAGVAIVTPSGLRRVRLTRCMTAWRV